MPLASSVEYPLRQLLEEISSLLQTSPSESPEVKVLALKTELAFVSEISNGGVDRVTALLLSSSPSIKRLLYRLIERYGDTRRLQDHAGKTVWRLFAVPCCLYTGTLSLTVQLPLTRDETSDAVGVLKSAGYFPAEARVILAEYLIPRAAVDRLAPGPYLGLISQTRTQCLPTDITLPMLPIPAGMAAPYYLLGVVDMKYQTKTNDVGDKEYVNRMSHTLSSRFDSVPGRVLSPGAPVPFSLALRSDIVPFLRNLVRTGHVLGGRGLSLIVNTVAEERAVHGSLRVALHGHPSIQPLDISFGVPAHMLPAIRDVVLKGVKGLPVKLVLPH
jgi:hypothetical protein